MPIKSVRIRLMEAVTVVLDWEHWWDSSRTCLGPQCLLHIHE